VGLKVRWLDGVKHEVTEDMVKEAGQWIGKWGLLG
jgi:predicted esterase